MTAALPKSPRKRPLAGVLITGALAVSVLAVVADLALLGLQRMMTSPGLRQTAGANA